MKPLFFLNLLLSIIFSLKGVKSNQGLYLDVKKTNNSTLNAHFKKQIPSKTFNFKQLTAGDCVMESGSSVTIWADGNIKFSGTVWTNHTHSGDQWHHFITFKDYRGLELFTIKFEGPSHMNDNGTHYNFGPFWRKYDPKFFNDIALATAKGFC